jgi:hypothetical protein
MYEKKYRISVYEILVEFGEYFKEFSSQSTVKFLIR